MSAPARIQVVVPLHQPPTTGDSFMERALELCYGPLVSALEATQGARVALHITGRTLDYLARRHEGFLLRIKDLAKRGQVEVLGGLFYGGIPSLLGELDVRAQIQMTTEFWDSLLGWPPSGFWLPELAWGPETPRLLQDTGLEYGFVSSSQLINVDDDELSLVCLERGGQRMPAFVLDPGLSAALPSTEVEQWVAAAQDRTAGNPSRVVSVWVRGESLGLEPGTLRWCQQEGWLQRWLQALADGTRLRSELPAEAFITLRPVPTARVDDRCAPEIGVLGGLGGQTWVDLPARHVEVDTLHRRMLRASDKLREAIGTMEDEELEESWSDSLATAQRLVFAAQAPDAFWHGPTAGFSDPAVRDATMVHIAQAEQVIDTLVQGEDDWVSAEDADLDGDLLDEVLVANRLLTAWLVTARGGEIRTIEHRPTGHNVLDVGTRRSEAFHDAMLLAPAGDGAPVPAGRPPRRGEGLCRLDADIPTQEDARDRCGIRDWLMPADAEPGSFFAGTGGRPLAAGQAWEVRENAIDEDGDCSYRLRVSTSVPEGVASAAPIEVDKSVTVPIDAPEVRLRYELRPGDSEPWLLGTEIPVRLGTRAARLLVDGNVVEPDDTGSVLRGVSNVRVEAADGEAVEVQLPTARDVWCCSIRTPLRTLEGYRVAEQGLVLVALARVAGDTDVELGIRLVEPREAP